MSLPAVKIILPPSPVPEAVPPNNSTLPAAAAAEAPPEIIIFLPAVLDAVALGFIFTSELFTNLIPPQYIFNTSPLK